MLNKKITRDELLILLRDTYVQLNDLSNKLRDTCFENMDDIIAALTRQQAPLDTTAQHGRNGTKFPSCGEVSAPQCNTGAPGRFSSPR